MAKYELKQIDLSSVNNIDDYNKALLSAESKVFNLVNEAFKFCGMKLHKERCGYTGTKDNIMYVLTRIQ